MKLVTLIQSWFDSVNDFIQGIIFLLSGIIIFGIMPLLNFLTKYNLNIDYAIWGSVGQTAFHFAKFRFPELAGRHRHTDAKIGTKVVNYIIDCMLSSLIGMLCTDIIVVNVFNATNNIYIVISAICIGAFYETILKYVVRKIKRFIKSKEE